MRPTTAVRRIPPNLFSIGFGLAGLAEVWRASAPMLGTGEGVPDGIDLLAAAIWLAVLVGYLSGGVGQVVADLKDRTLAPFVSLPAITPVVLATGLTNYAFGAARVLVVVFTVMTIAIGGWLTGQWIVGDLDEQHVHPGYFLPTVAGGFVTSFAAADVHLHSLAEMSFGIGMLCWVLLGSLLLHRLFFQRRLPLPLVPTLAWEVAPPVVAGIAYHALNAGSSDRFAYALAGYALLMVLVQFRFVPLYSRLPFTPGFWTFTFAYAAVATDAVEWISVKHPAGATVYAWLITAAVTLFIAAIATRSIFAVRAGQFFPTAAVVGPPLVEMAGADGIH